MINLESNDIPPTKNGKIDTTLQNNELSTSETIDVSTQNTVPSTSEKSVEFIPGIILAFKFFSLWH